MICMGSAERKRVCLWNLKVPTGTPVVRTLDNGQKQNTKTRSEAWVLGNGTGPAVVLVEGVAGGYALDRIEVL